MSDYIKRGDAIKASTPAFRNAFSDWEVGWIESKDDTKDMIENLPSADVAPVRHGRWSEENIIACGGFVREYYECSICFGRNNRRSRYCPNCGARMDGEDNDD